MAGSWDNDNVHIGDAVLRDLKTWTDEKTEKVNKAAKKIQQEMKRQIEAATPVRDYPYNNGTVMRIIVHRGGNVKRAVWQQAEHQPGAMKKGWTTVTLNKNYWKKIYGVRNKAYPSLIHLVNFDHDVVSHGEKTWRVVHGTEFVTKVQKNGQDKLDAEIKKILSE